jgi:heat shock protein 5
MQALEDGRSWLDSNPDADVDEIKEKQHEVEGICAPIVSKYYQAGSSGVDAEEDNDGYDEL